MRFGNSSSRHSRQTAIHAEVVLQGDRSIGLCFTLDGSPFLGFYGLVQPVRKAPSRLRTARILIDNDDFVLLDNIIDIFFHQQVRAKKLAQVMGTLFS